MTTDVTGTRPAVRPDEPDGVEPKPTTVVNPTGVSGVAVYDHGPDGTASPSTRPSGSMVEDPMPIETRSASSMIAWIIGLVILVILVYFLWQMFF